MQVYLLRERQTQQAVRTMFTGEHRVQMRRNLNGLPFDADIVELDRIRVDVTAC